MLSGREMDKVGVYKQQHNKSSPAFDANQESVAAWDF